LHPQKTIKEALEAELYFFPSPFFLLPKMDLLPVAVGYNSRSTVTTKNNTRGTPCTTQPPT